MTKRQNSVGSKKEGRITHAEKVSATKQVGTILKDMKDKMGEVVLVQINNRTSIELPASLTREERDERVARYLQLHQSKI